MAERNPNRNPDEERITDRNNQDITGVDADEFDDDDEDMDEESEDEGDE